MKSIADFRNWEGAASALAEVAAQIFSSLGSEDAQLTERLVRYYAQSGVLEKPRRDGREAQYGFRQILQLVVARKLATDGWPLAKIAEYTAQSDEKALMDLIPRNLAQETSTGDQATNFSPILSHSIQKVRHRLILEQQLKSLGNVEGIVARSECCEFDITPWCKLQLNKIHLGQMTPKMAQQLGEAITAVLLQSANHDVFKSSLSEEIRT